MSEVVKMKNVAELNFGELAGVGVKIDTLDATLNGKHIPTDRYRWSDFYGTQLDLYEQIAASQGLKPDFDNTVNVPQGTPYTVTGPQGGLLTVNALNSSGFFTVVSILGKDGWNSDGLIEGVSITKYFRLLNGDQIQVDNASSVTFTPAIPDPTSPPAVMLTQINDNMARMYARLLEEAQKIYDGSTPKLDYTQPLVVLGTGGLITLGDNNGWTATSNGGIVVTYSATLGAAKILLVDGVQRWQAVLALLGASTTKSPSEPIQVSTGQVVTVTGLVGLVESLDVTFYPNA